MTMRQIAPASVAQAAHAIRAGEEPICLPGCCTFQLSSEENGLAYQIFVSVPEGKAPASGFPILYALDANSDFITLAETVRRTSRRSAATGINPAIVVGIGYPRTQAYDVSRRYFDFTLAGPADGSDASSAGYGGQRAFMRFLSQQLLPLVESRYHGDARRRVLIGHSLAGYFVLEVIASQPNLFSSYVSLSPSIWWDRSGLRSRLSETAGARGDIRLYVGAGRYEQELAPWQPAESRNEEYHALRAARRMVENARELTEEIGASSGPGTVVRFELGDQEDHATVFTALLCRALRFAQPHG